MTPKTLLDELDIALLVELQKECRNTLDELAAKVGAPASTVHYRLKRLERADIIQGYYAKVNPEKLDLDYITMIQLRVDPAPGYYQKVGEKLAKIQGVWAVYLLLGDFDFLVMTKSRNREGFMKIVDEILEIGAIKQTSTSVVGMLIKEDPRLDLE